MNNNVFILIFISIFLFGCLNQEIPMEYSKLMISIAEANSIEEGFIITEMYKNENNGQINIEYNLVYLKEDENSKILLTQRLQEHNKDLTYEFSKFTDEVFEKTFKESGENIELIHLSKKYGDYSYAFKLIESGKISYTISIQKKNYLYLISIVSSKELDLQYIESFTKIAESKLT